MGKKPATKHTKANPKQASDALRNAPKAQKVRTLRESAVLVTIYTALIQECK
jgi:hypothetical protein